MGRFNETIDLWIGYIDDYSFEELVRKPNPRTWSLGQVYIHITEDTPYHLQQMKAALHGDADSEKEMHDDAKAMFRNNAFPDMQIEGASTNESVRQPESKDELRQLLTDIRRSVNDLYRQYDFRNSKGKSLHPGLWYFTASEWLQFTEMHMRHHFHQKKRIEEAIIASHNPR